MCQLTDVVFSLYLTLTSSTPALQTQPAHKQLSDGLHAVYIVVSGRLIYHICMDWSLMTHMVPNCIVVHLIILPCCLCRLGCWLQRGHGQARILPSSTLENQGLDFHQGVSLDEEMP